MRTVWAAIALSLLAACAVTTQPTPSPLISCSEPRPQVCTMEYAPVCAHLFAGSIKEYSSPCNACADDAVAAYLPGACPQ